MSLRQQICSCYTITYLIFAYLDWAIVFDHSIPCYYSCILGEGYFVIYTYLVTLSTFSFSMCASLIHQRKQQVMEEEAIALKVANSVNEKLLHNMLPPRVAEELISNGRVIPEVHANTTIFFSDVQNFTKIATQVPPVKVMMMLNELYSVMDFVAKSIPDLYKVETIGDAYVISCGATGECDLHAVHICNFALLVRECIKLVLSPVDKRTPLQIRIGIHSGTTISGVIGNLMPRFCLFGDAMNTASRMESTGEVGSIQISEATVKYIEAMGYASHFVIQERGMVDMKGKGIQKTYWLVSNTDLNPVANRHALKALLKACSKILRRSVKSAYDASVIAELVNAAHNNFQPSAKGGLHDSVSLSLSLPKRISYLGSFREYLPRRSLRIVLFYTSLVINKFIVKILKEENHEVVSQKLDLRVSLQGELEKLKGQFKCPSIRTSFKSGVRASEKSRISAYSPSPSNNQDPSHADLEIDAILIDKKFQDNEMQGVSNIFFFLII